MGWSRKGMCGLAWARTGVWACSHTLSSQISTSQSPPPSSRAHSCSLSYLSLPSSLQECDMKASTSPSTAGTVKAYRLGSGSLFINAASVSLLSGSTRKYCIATAKAFATLVSPRRDATLAACCSAGPLFPSEPSQRVKRPRTVGVVTRKQRIALTPVMIKSGEGAMHSLPEQDQRKMPASSQEMPY